MKEIKGFYNEIGLFETSFFIIAKENCKIRIEPFNRQENNLEFFERNH